MAKVQGVWGIDIGQCAVKALRCLPSDDPGKITADAFDFIEYPQILSQPDANRQELIAEALEQFLSRNEVRGDRVAVSVPGQNGLARFVKLPPVEVKKIPDLVKYEARNQIPFDLDDVEWDYQQMGGGMIEEGFALDIEMGLFAMKREQVLKTLRPFNEANIDVDLVQLTPLALFNYIAFDQMKDESPDPDMYDPENPPDSVMLLSLGTDTTDLVITDGFRVWQRSLPIGGNHFTKALTKELKQTFAKAEHIKRNAAQAENPKALFQAMRPVFADLVTEVQRSLNFFANIHKKATVSRGYALGNTAKLPGLVRFLSQNLKIPIQRADEFRGLEGPGIVDAPAFQENVLAFPVCYGLCLQELADTAIETNLIPQEILTERLIQSKKPWAVGAIAALALGLAVSFVGYWYACHRVRPEPFAGIEGQVQGKISKWGSEKETFDTQVIAFDASDQTGRHLLQDKEQSLRWIQLFKVIDLCLPRDAGNPPPNPIQRNQVFITSINHRESTELSGWFRGAQAAAKAKPTRKQGNAEDAGGLGEVGSGGGGVNVEPAGTPKAPAVEPEEETPLPDGAPKGKGYVVTIVGHHFHNNEDDIHDMGPAFLRKTLILKLQQDTLPVAGGKLRIEVKKFGILHPTVVYSDTDVVNKKPNPWYDPEKKADNVTNPERLIRCDFVIQFALIDPNAAVAETENGDTFAGDTPGPGGGANSGNGRVATNE